MHKGRTRLSEAEWVPGILTAIPNEGEKKLHFYFEIEAQYRFLIKRNKK